MGNIIRNLPIVRNLSMVSEKEKRYWVPMLMGIGLSIILFGLTTIRSEGIGSYVGWFTLANGIGMFWWGARWSRVVARDSGNDRNDKGEPSSL